MMKRYTNFSLLAIAFSKASGSNFIRLAAVMAALIIGVKDIHAQFGCDPGVPNFQIDIMNTGDCIDILSVSPNGECCSDSLSGESCISFELTLPVNNCVALLRDGAIARGLFFVDDCTNPQTDGSNLTPSDLNSGTMNFVYCTSDDGPFDFQLCGKECCVLDVDCPSINGGFMSCVEDVPPPAMTIEEFEALPGAAINENCEPLELRQEVIITTGDGCPGDTIFVVHIYTIVDRFDSVLCRRFYRVADGVAPSFTVPADITIDCDDSRRPTNTGEVTDASDNCQGVPSVTFRDSFGLVRGCEANENRFRIWSVEDGCGNVTTQTQRIIVRDLTPPVLTLPSDTTVNCQTDTSSMVLGMAMATDNCDLDDVVSYDSLVTSMCPMAYTIHRIWRATDECGNSSTDIQIIEVIDTTAPTFALPSDVVIDCAADTTPANTGTPDISPDNCHMTMARHTDDITRLRCVSNYNIERTWIVSDECGNSNTGIQIIRVRDNTPPTFTLPSDTTVECQAFMHPSNLGFPSDLMDDCNSVNIPEWRDSIDDEECNSTYVLYRIWSFEDECGNSSRGIQSIFVIDTTAPAITIPADAAVACGEDTSTAALGMAIGMDLCDDEVAISHVDELIPGDCKAEFTILRIWSAEDSCSNVSIDTQIIEVECNERIGASMEIVDIDPPSSGRKGNLNATFEIKILNRGNAKLTDLTLENDIADGFLASFREIVAGGEPTITASTADIDPIINGGFDGRINTDIFNGSSGCLRPGQMITLQYTMEVRPKLVPGTLWCPNQVLAGAMGPCMEPVEDLSDTGNNPAGTNGGQFGDTGGEDDPTLLRHDCFSEWAAQMACNKHSNISLGEKCDLDIPPSVILEGEEPFCDIFFEMMITDHHGRIVPNPVPGHYKGETLYVKVIDAVHGNSCWGTILIEDKYRPTIECTNDTIYCNALDSLPPPVFYDNCDPNPELRLWREKATILTCDSFYTKRLVRQWEASDTCGNKSYCDQIVMLRRIPIDSVERPKNFTLENNCALKCNGIYPLDSAGHPDPSFTGAPSINGIPVYPFYQYCNLSANYEDRIIKHDDCLKKILRLWRIVEWHCGSASVREITQLIHIVDEEPPIIVCPDVEYDVTTNGGYKCEADVHLHAPFVYDSCAHDSVRVDIRYPGGILRNQREGIVVLPFGIHTITYVAYDKCYNSSSCSIEIEVKDHTPPVTVCDGFTTIGLNELGEAHLYAHTLDDGTYDDCYLDSFAVMRMDMGANCNYPDTLFRSYVRFCCADVGTNVMVIFRAWDKAGNYNDCMVEVEVQDKVPPLVYCPPNITVSCDFHFELDSLDKYFGTVVQDYHDRQPIVIDDPHFKADGPKFDGHVLENCMVDIRQSYVDSLSQCRTGFILRGFEITDAQGLSSMCYQRITIEDYDPFDSLDIVWPLNYDTDVCMADFHPDSLPDIYGRPSLADDKCSLVGAEWEDHIFSFTTDPLVCFKVLRKWKVIDWCDFEFVNGSREYRKYTYEQIIKVTNMEPPRLTMDCDDKTVCTYDPDCEDGYIELIMTATDECTDDDDLNWEFKVDLDINGTIDTAGFGVGATIDASGDYPIGMHRVTYTFEDQCGNKATCSQDFTIVNCKKPTAYCKNGIIVDLMPIDTNRDGQVDVGLIDVWARDLDDNSGHSCGNSITLSFSPDTTDIYRRYNCDSLGMRTVRIYVTDRTTGEQDFCITFVEVQDNNNACPNNIVYGNINGRLLTNSDVEISTVTIDLMGSNPMKSNTYDGAYEIKNVLLNGDYEVMPTKDVNHLNGVSTRDLVLIQRHLLGYENLKGPYGMLAADVNESGSVTARDLSEIRRLLLGTYAEFPNTESWRFVDSRQTFVDPQDPFNEPLQETYVISDMPGDMNAVDFVGIKMGDVDQSADPTEVRGNITRDLGEPWTIHVEPIEDNLTSDVNFAFIAKSAIELNGLQMTLQFDPKVMKFENVSSGIMEIDQHNLGLKEIEKGVILISWNDEHSVDLESMNILFELSFERVSPGDADLQMGLSHIANEVYDEDLDVRPIRMSLSTQSETNQLLVTQNRPNPFDLETIVRISSQSKTVVLFTVYDVTGKVFVNKTVDLQRGWNEIKVSKSDLSQGGLYYYQVDGDHGSLTRKMILME